MTFLLSFLVVHTVLVVVEVVPETVSNPVTTAPSSSQAGASTGQVVSDSVDGTNAVGNSAMTVDTSCGQSVSTMGYTAQPGNGFPSSYQQQGNAMAPGTTGILAPPPLLQTSSTGSVPGMNGIPPPPGGQPYNNVPMNNNMPGQINPHQAQMMGMNMGGMPGQQQQMGGGQMNPQQQQQYQQQMQQQQMYQQQQMMQQQRGASGTPLPMPPSNGGNKQHRKAWHTAEDQSTRNSMIERIVGLLQQRRPNATPDWQEKLPHMAKRLENELYMQAETLAEYSDPYTLKNRLQQLALSMGNKQAAKQPGQGGQGQAPGGVPNGQQPVQPGAPGMQPHTPLHPLCCVFLYSVVLSLPSKSFADIMSSHSSNLYCHRDVQHATTVFSNDATPTSAPTKPITTTATTA